MYNGELDFDNVISWLTNSSLPSLVIFEEEYAKVIFNLKGGRDTLVLFTKDFEDKTSKAFE